MEEGENCQLVLQLPDGSQHSHNFKLGATVAYVKLQVQQLYGVPMEKQLLQTGGKTLIDPRRLTPLQSYRPVCGASGASRGLAWCCMYADRCAIVMAAGGLQSPLNVMLHSQNGHAADDNNAMDASQLACASLQPTVSWCCDEANVLENRAINSCLFLRWQGMFHPRRPLTDPPRCHT